MKENFETIIEKLSPTLRRITHKLNGHFTFFDEDDLFQEALEHLWISYNKDMLGDKTDSYVLQGCYFHLRNYIRKTVDTANLVSLQGIYEDGDTSIEKFLGREDHSIEDSAENTAISESDAVINMTERERTVLKLSMDGSTVREIGRILGVSHVMIIKIRKNIRKRFGNVRKIFDTGYQN